MDTVLQGKLEKCNLLQSFSTPLNMLLTAHTKLASSGNYRDGKREWIRVQGKLQNCHQVLGNCSMVLSFLPAISN